MDTVTAALDYAKRGWGVVPLHKPTQGVCSCRKKNCTSPGKHPRTEHGPKDGSKDEQQIKQWFAHWPDANLAILTGQSSGLLVLDVDGEDGKASLKALTAIHGALPKTLCVKTGRTGSDGKRTGCHYYFRIPAGVSIRNSVCILGAGLDIRADGGYVVAPPSLHPSGLLYEWLTPLQALADLPAWMVEVLREAKPAQQRIQNQSELISEGGRNAALTSLAGTMRRRGMSPEAIEAALLTENAARCNPPLPDSEVREIARSIVRYEPAPSLTARPIVQQPDHEAAANKVRRQWPDSLTEAAFYGLAGDFVRLVEPHSEADPAALLFQCLCVMGSIIGRGPYYSAGADKHFTNLYMVIVGNSAKARKGTSWSETRRLCEMVDPAWTRTRILSGLSTGEGLIHAVRDEIKELVQIREKGRVIDREEQITDTGESDKRLLCVEGEFAQPLQCAAREGSTLSAVIRQAWDGVALRVLAKSAKATCAEPHVSIVGHITGTELQRLLTASDAANGFANRFIWVCSARSKHLPFGGSVDEEGVSAIGARARDAVAFARGVGGIAWAPDAAELWAEEYCRLSDGKQGLLGLVTARAEAQAIRLAIIYALLDKSAKIRLEHLRAALELWRYSADSAAYIFGEAIGDPTADAIMELLRSRPEGVSRTNLSEHFSHNKKKAELDAAISLAQSNGLLRIEKQTTAGRPTEMLRLVSV